MQQPARNLRLRRRKRAAEMHVPFWERCQSTSRSASAATRNVVLLFDDEAVAPIWKASARTSSRTLSSSGAEAAHAIALYSIRRSPVRRHLTPVHRLLTVLSPHAHRSRHDRCRQTPRGRVRAAARLKILERRLADARGARFLRRARRIARNRPDRRGEEGESVERRDSRGIPPGRNRENLRGSRAACISVLTDREFFREPG